MYLRVRVIAGAKKESVAEKGETLVVSVKEPAEQNRANTRVRELVAGKYGLTIAQVRILHGHHSPGKLLSLDMDNKK